MTLRKWDRKIRFNLPGVRPEVPFLDGPDGGT